MSRHGRGRGNVLESLGTGALTFGGAAAAVGASWKFAEFAVKCKKLFEVRSGNDVFVRLVERVKMDLAEAERLMAQKSVQEAMRKDKAKTLYIQGLVRGVHDAIEGMNKYTKHVAEAGWWLSPHRRLWWVLHEHGKLQHRQMELAMAREGIMEVIGSLDAFEEKPEKGGGASEHRREYPEYRRESTEFRTGRPEDEVRHTSKHVDVDVDVRRRDARHEAHDERPHIIRSSEKRRDEHIEGHEEHPFRRGDKHVNGHEEHPFRRGDKHVEVREEHQFHRGDRHVEGREERPYRQDGYVGGFEERPYRPGDWSHAGLYDGRLDGPLATRPRFWTQQSPGADYAGRVQLVDGGDFPQRAPWPTTSKL